MERKNFIFFATSSFNSLPHRDQFLATSLARLGHKVTFIEEIPSVASVIKKKLNRQKKEGSNISNLIFERYIPPIIPTFFRSSYSRNLDKFIFKRWFKSLIKKIDLTKSVVIIFSPIWFYYLDGYYDIKTLIYDIHDDIQISSRNERTLCFLKIWEDIGIKKANFIICSSRGLQIFYENKYSIKVHLIYNGIDSNLLNKLSLNQNNSTKKIGIVGSFNVKPQCYNIEILKKIINKYPDYKLVLVGNVNSTIKKNLSISIYPNIELKGFMAGDQLWEEVLTWTVCLIPFINSSVTSLINPLKLYEYIACGKPIVAFDNFDYEDAKEFIYLSKNDDEFLSNVENAILNSNIKINKRVIDYLFQKTWEKRVQDLLNLI